MTISNRALWAAMLAATTSCYGMASAPAHAQATTMRFDLPAQDLGTALRAIAQASGQEVLFADEDVRGKRSRAILGSYTAEQAVRLVIGDRLVVAMEAGALVVRAPAKDGAVSSDENAITVTGSRIRGAEGPYPSLSCRAGRWSSRASPTWRVFRGHSRRISPEGKTPGSREAVTRADTITSITRRRSTFGGWARTRR